jgi:uncharacterized repeat protein (TIGR01451 family)
MPTLAELFSPGAPALVEGLRTLVVSPDRFVEPGMTVNATFSFTNLGGAPAKGLRARFALPQGLRYLVGSARADAQALDERGGEPTIFGSNGAEIGDVPPGAQRQISVSYLVAPTIEDGTVIELQAALASLDVPVIGSNCVRLVVRSRPELAGKTTLAQISAVRTAEPGGEVLVSARVHNTGESSAHDVVVVLPLPEHTAFLANSARVDGKPFPAADEPFGFVAPMILTPKLGPGATLSIEYRAMVSPHLADETVLAVRGAVAAREVAEFALPPAELAIRSSESFANAETALTIDAPDEVEPGAAVRVVCSAKNSGTDRARGVELSIVLPDGVAYAPGSATLNGNPLPASALAKGATLRVPVGDLRAGAAAALAIEARVAAPARDGQQLAVAAHVLWASGARDFERALTVRARPQFGPAWNHAEVPARPLVNPADPAIFEFALMNEGATAATDARLRVTLDDGLCEPYAEIDGKRIEIANGTIELRALAPFEPHAIALHARVAAEIADRTELRAGARLETAQTESVDLGEARVVVRSRPRFSPETSAIALVSEHPLRPDGFAELRAVVVNVGTDVARDARLLLRVSPEARIDGVEGAVRDGNTLIFGDMAAGERAEATIRVRLADFVAAGREVTVEGWASGKGMIPLVLTPGTVPTFAEPRFEDVALTSFPPETVDAGTEIAFALALRNSGDGAASRLSVSAVSPACTVYIPGSTTVNDVMLLDAGGGSRLWAPGGLVLGDVGPGVEINLRWRAIVNTPLPAGTLIEATAKIEWDEGQALQVTSPPVRVRSAPAFGVAAAGLPFSVAGAVPHNGMPTRSLPPAAARIAVLPPAQPITRPAEGDDSVISGDPSAQERAALPVSYLVLDAGRLARKLEFFENTRYPGLMRHLFAARALFPDQVLGIARGVTDRHLDALRASVTDTFDRLFIKMSTPNFQPAARDLEDETARTALLDVLWAIADAPAAPADEHRRGLVRIAGPLERERLLSLAQTLREAPLGSASAFSAVATFLGTTIRCGETLSHTLGEYRLALIEALDAFADSPPAAFQAALCKTGSPALDQALRSLETTLRSALEPAPS